MINEVLNCDTDPTTKVEKRRRIASKSNKCWRFLFILIQVTIIIPSYTVAQGDRSLMGLISPREIAELTQLATDLAAQTMQSNSDILSKPGRPEMRPISLNQSPSEMIGQSLTNIWQPASQQLSSQFVKNTAPRALPQPLKQSDGEISSFTQRNAFKPTTPQNRALSSMNSLFNFGGLGNTNTNNKDDLYEPSLFSMSSLFGGGAPQSRQLALGSPNLNLNRGISSGQEGLAREQPAAMNSIMELANSFLGGGTNAPSRRRSYGNYDEDGGGSSGMGKLLSMAGGGGRKSSGAYQMPTLRQFLPMAEKNFGFDQGEGCLPFVGEFMRMAYGNCVKQADQHTWDTWGKEIQNALMGGKIDLLRASKETCKKGAEREQCGQVRRAVSDCDIIGSIQLVTNMQRSISRCDEISGIIDQNPTTVLNQMNGLINGEMAQGFLNNFLG